MIARVWWIAFFFLITTPCLAQPNAAKAPAPLVWPEIEKEHKPWAYWWWMGNAVDKENLTSVLETYSRAGLGGMHTIPIYGVKGEESRFIDYLSPKWIEMLNHTVAEAKRLGMGIDMTSGTGWNFGGPQVKIEDAVTKVVVKKYTLKPGQTLPDTLIIEDELEKGFFRKVQALMAYSASGKVLDLTAKVPSTGKLNWTATNEPWTLYALFESGKKGAVVERPAPGGRGYMVDPFSAWAMGRYLMAFQTAFTENYTEAVRAFYHDSYEYHHATWSHDLLAEFEQRRGYDLRHHLPALIGEGSDETIARVRCDYRETISDLHLEYIQTWARWAQGRGTLSRNQAHGSPSNLIDTYAATDIAETEINHPSYFDLPGLDYFTEITSDPNVHMMKFASSATHLAGHRLTSSESGTWLNEHFKISLALVKPELDKGFTSGINHIFYHGIPYSPPDAEWPGWLFYATTHFGPSNSIWADFPALNRYVARCQSILQSGEPDNDILLYYPAFDLWQQKDGINERFGDLVQPTHIHAVHEWLKETPFYGLSEKLLDSGFSADFVSDKFLRNATTRDGKVILVGPQTYRLIVVPQTEYMPHTTLSRLADLARAGVTVIFQNKMPQDVPGLGTLEARRRAFKATLSKLEWQETEGSSAKIARMGQGQFYQTDDVGTLLKTLNVTREAIADQNIKFIRRTHAEGHHYFLTSLGNYPVDGWVTLGTKAQSVVIMDPMTEETGVATTRQTDADQTQVYLQLRPGQSCILRTFDTKKIDGPAWKYLTPAAAAPTEITGTWRIEFGAGGPQKPADITTRKLASWTTLGDEEAQRFAGTARYRIDFQLPDTSADDWRLDLGLVRESARVSINGKEVGTLFSVPFEVLVGKYLRPGKNELTVEVTNLAANRIRDLDQRKVVWRKFYDINFISPYGKRFDASGWELTDSGLLGPVRLVPMKEIVR